MPSPTRRKGTQNFWFYERIPADVVRILEALPGAMRPKGWGKQFVWISLGTANENDAKAKCAAVTTQYLEDLKRLRTAQPIELTQEQIAALQHEAELILLGKLPPLSLQPTRSDEAPTFAERLLASRKLLATPEGVGRLQSAIQVRLAEHAEKEAEVEKRRGKGDFGAALPAPVGRTWEELAANPDRVPFLPLVEKWKKGKKRKPSTLDRWQHLFPLFVTYTGCDDALKITPKTWGVYADKRREKDGISAHGLLNNDFAAIHSVLRWAARPTRRLIPRNPFEELWVELKEEVGQRTQLREKHFYDEEIAIILRAARQHPEALQDGAPGKVPLQRWAPLLLAYTGARPTEVMQLTGDSFCLRNGRWVVNFTPDKGPIKDNTARDVPLHEHLLELGVLKEVQQAASEALFYSLPKGRSQNADDKRTAQEVRDDHIQSAAKRLGNWVRDDLKIGGRAKGLSPSHAWRNTFVVKATASGINEQVIAMILGHSLQQTQTGRYNATAADTIAEAMQQFRRYKF